jgi:serpin B
MNNGRKLASIAVALLCIALVQGITIQGITQATTTPNDTITPSQSDIVTLANANNRFAFDMLQYIRDEDGNLFFSPYSIWQAFALTYGGARDSTADQMEATLHYPVSQDELPTAIHDLDLALVGSAMSDDVAADEQLQLNIANALWVQADFPFWSDYISLATEDYGAAFQEVDFLADPENVANMINTWVDDATEGKITQVVERDSFDEQTRFVMINAIYFNASWRYQFDEEVTDDLDFSLLDGSIAQVPTMYLNADLNYTNQANYQAVELPYVGENLAMLVFLPNEGAFEDFSATFTVDQFNATITALHSQEDVRLYLPSFEYETDLNLVDPLSELGMPYLFDGQAADLTGIADLSNADLGNLYVSDAFHKAYVLVDESGTEAAAVTVQIGSALTEVQEPNYVILRIDRPFFFAIYDQSTQTILFLGRVMNPAS